MSIAVFRVDASLNIGNGHVMRCLTLAEVLRQHGTESHFICSLHDGNLLQFIEEKNYKIHPLKVAETKHLGHKSLDHKSWLGNDVRTDALLTLEVLTSLNAQVDWLIVDHYALDEAWEKMFRSVCKRIMVIDDLADRAHDCDILLDQTYLRSKTDYSDLLPKRNVCLLGAQFALLRPEFLKYREYSFKRRINPKIEQLLVTLGGVDKANITGDVLNFLQFSNLRKSCRVVVVLGCNAPWVESIKKQAAQMEFEVKVLVNEKNMAKVMAESDFCIGAAGGTTWERCCLGLPTFLLQLADNQKKILEELSRTDSAVALNEPRDINLYLEDENLLEALLNKLSMRSRLLCDGLGAEKTVKYMKKISHEKRHIA